MSREATDTGSIESPVGVVGHVLARNRTWALRYMGGKGLAIALIGLSWIVQPSAGRAAGIEWMDLVQPWMIGSVWMLAGLWAAIASRTRALALHKVAWFGLIATPAITALYFTVSWVYALLPVDGGSQRGWITAASYVAFSMAYCVARLHLESEEISEAWGDD
ncbi:hypothetical protein [Brachybacterium kimchii]|uniref:Transmembrane protein n=1 Tax=Brachybacterium kimchii TaxID=2942909 RepID=A0ABY4N7V9_9MICO|nr:hypothetical protein [Brachybacterium kimchii]UQN30645.1 hypothetical protein M4486_04910 [Brachybacterium kimchii]